MGKTAAEDREIDVKNSVTTWLAAGALLVVAGSVLARFNAGGGDWPAVTLTELADADSMVSSASFAGEPKLINFWGSWCVACREEHAVLQRLSEAGIALLGVNHLDERDDALRWLDYFGDPYETSLYDSAGIIGEALDLEALPVTLVIDAEGAIRYRHLGVLDKKTADTVIVPLLDNLRRDH
ncbi:MAG: redoxin family protein [Gammaproteobacteria bacterium]|nr:redoxin family protein [Gammaproteobacteria bacterium]NCF59383.1 redoxin family protein [Gammaproteobacteria bacterium]